MAHVSDWCFFLLITFSFGLILILNPSFYMGFINISNYIINSASFDITQNPHTSPKAVIKPVFYTPSLSHPMAPQHVLL